MIMPAFAALGIALAEQDSKSARPAMSGMAEMRRSLTFVLLSSEHLFRSMRLN
jgi:hypothetical protein